LVARAKCFLPTLVSRTCSMQISFSSRLYRRSSPAGGAENSCGDVPGFHLAQCSRSAIAGGQKQHGRCNKRRCDENPGADRAQRTSDGKDLASGPCIPPFGVKRTLDAPCFLGGGRHSYAVIRPRGSEALPSSSHEADGRRNNGHQTRPASSGGVLAAPTSLSRCFAMKTSAAILFENVARTGPLSLPSLTAKKGTS
jgi:hypothetical protein